MSNDRKSVRTQFIIDYAHPRDAYYYLNQPQLRQKIKAYSLEQALRFLFNVLLKGYNFGITYEDFISDCIYGFGEKPLKQIKTNPDGNIAEAVKKRHKVSPSTPSMFPDDA